MLPYWILFAICGTFALLRVDYQSIERRNQIGIGVALCFIALMIGLRYKVGGDYESYDGIHRYFSNVDLPTALQWQDPAYGLIDWTAGHLGFGVWLTNLVCGAIFCWGLGKLLRRHPSPFLGLTIAVPYLIIVVAMGYTRQAAALGFLMAGMARFDRSNILYFCVMCLLATMFHKSAIVMVPLGLLALKHNRVMMIALMILLSGLLYYAFVASSVDRLLTNYVTQSLTSQGAMVRVLMGVAPAMMLIIFGKKFRFTDDQLRLYRNLAFAVLFALAALFVGVPSAPVDRLALYTLPIQLVVFTRMTALLPADSRSAAAMTAGLVVLYATVLYVWLNHADYAGFWIPYRTVLFS